MASTTPDDGQSGAVSEHLTSPRSSDAICTVLRFEQPSGAHQNLAPSKGTRAVARTSERVKYVDSISMSFYLRRKGLPCCRHPVISVQ